MKPSLKKNYTAYINGGFVPSQGAVFAATNPATGEHLAHIARCNAADVDTAVQAAQRALPGWKATSYEERAALLNRLADALEKELPRLALIDALDVGRRIAETRLDHQKAIAQYRYFAGAILTHEDYGRPIPDGYLMVKREPMGVVGQIIPWNVPALMVALKVAPALAAGNTLVLKPDENASLSTLEFAEIAGGIFPPGVLNVVPGFGEEVGAALTAHPKVAKLAFTGSPEVGRIIAHAGAERLVPVSLELGGKSPNIVFPDADDLDAVVDNALFAALYCNGQSCLAGTRLFVHDDIYASFVDKLASAASRLKVGNPLDESAHLSCLVSAKQGKRVLEYIGIGKAEGAKVLFGGERESVAGCEAGYFIQPTLLEVRHGMRVEQEEIFGPVLSILRWSDYEQMLKEANGVPYGLAAGLYTADLENAMRTADALEAGSVWINQYFNLSSGVPFGGVKESGIGMEHGRETLNIYSRVKSVTVRNRVIEPWYLG
ncbi:aldehyde dehydrogenase family protein [Pseudomonas sp. Q1-7]|uniref:aldehyde dehydrogenase family protein n=1 Tax=Pseudomonas sp. Q1-7 TaxID=3020843 RepID=UPI0023019A2C|nr:aldehyde dehydrogenase family protein [Pseudomonas sp. Q1-7]